MNRKEMLALSGTAIAMASTLLDAEAFVPRTVDNQGLTLPWYRRKLRWGQDWLFDRVPENYDLAWWREYWRRTSIEGLVVNAGGSRAFYPSKFTLQPRAKFLNGRDIYGETVQAAHDDGLVVLARTDSSVASEELFRAHPDWIARKQSGEPYRREDRYLTCINSAYFEQYFPGMMKEIIERSKPEGIIESAWCHLTREMICYCVNCKRKFHVKIGRDLPKRKDWNDPLYRQWIQWNYARRTELWEFNNRITKAAGGPHCIWTAMIWNGSFQYQNQRFLDMRELAKRGEFFYWDGYSSASTGSDSDAYGGDSIFSDLELPGDSGKVINQLTGWNKVATMTALTDLSEAPARMNVLDGIAGNLGPTWLVTNNPQGDRRTFGMPERVFPWHKQHEQYLTSRQPRATVGIVWSQRNGDYYGRDDAGDLVTAPNRGFTRALVRARIPYLPIHASDLAQQAQQMSVLILPNIGALSTTECGEIRKFARRGGAVVASGATSLFDEWGVARPDFGLADLFGAHTPSADFSRQLTKPMDSMLRLMPMPGRSSVRHPVLSGFDETDQINFGSKLGKLRLGQGVIVPLTLTLPSKGEGYDSTDPAESTDIAGLVLNAFGTARIAYLPAPLDRLYAQNGNSDHGNLLANIVRWAANGRVDFELEGPGLIDCHVFHQSKRLIIHLVNLSSEGAWLSPNGFNEIYSVGPLKVSVKLPEDVLGQHVESIVSGATPKMTAGDNWGHFEVTSVNDHEVFVIS